MEDRANRLIKLGHDSEEPDTTDSSEESDTSALEKDIADKKKLEEFGVVLKAALESVNKGIDIGVSKGFASARGGVADSFFGSIYEAISSALTLTAPGSLMERRIKTQTAFETSNVKINEKAKEVFRSKVVIPSKSLYESNFSSFMGMRPMVLI